MGSFVDYKLYVGEEGWTMKMYAELDLTGSTLLQVHLLKPDQATEVVKTAGMDGTDSTYANYVVETGAIDEVGIWAGKLYIEKGTLKKFGNTFTFEVCKKWK